MTKEQMIQLLVLLRKFDNQIHGDVMGETDIVYNLVLGTTCRMFGMSQMEVLDKVYAYRDDGVAA